MVEARNHPYVYYFKGAHVVYVLRELLGEDRMNQLFKPMLVDSTYPRKPSMAELAERILASASSQDRPRIKELLHEVVTYDLKILTAHRHLLPGGRIEITARVQAGKNVFDEQGRKRVLPIMDWMEVGFYRGGELIQVDKVYLDRERQTITLQTEGQPDTVSFDPRWLRLDPDYRDNRRKIESRQPRETEPAR